MINNGISFLSTLQMSSTDSLKRRISGADRQVEIADFANNNNVNDVAGMSATNQPSEILPPSNSNQIVDVTGMLTQDTSQIHSKVSSQIPHQSVDVTTSDDVTYSRKQKELPELEALDLNHSSPSQTVQSHVRLGNLETTL